jgi:uncharacterized membrane protein YhaH (DUF805 family)
MKPGNSEVTHVSGPYGPYEGGQQGGYPPPQQGYQQGGYQQRGYAQQGYPPPQQGFGTPQQGGQRGYLQGAPVDFQSAIRLQFENVMNFEGRASLSAYWWYALAAFAVNMVLEIFSFAIGSAAVSVLVLLLALVVGLSGLSVAVRRMHDTDKSGFMLLLSLIPIIGGIVVIVLLAMPGTPGQNRFG